MITPNLDEIVDGTPSSHNVVDATLGTVTLYDLPVDYNQLVAAQRSVLKSLESSGFGKTVITKEDDKDKLNFILAADQPFTRDDILNALEHKGPLYQAFSAKQAQEKNLDSRVSETPVKETSMAPASYSSLGAYEIQPPKYSGFGNATLRAGALLLTKEGRSYVSAYINELIEDMVARGNIRQAHQAYAIMQQAKSHPLWPRYLNEHGKQDLSVNEELELLVQFTSTLTAMHQTVQQRERAIVQTAKQMADAKIEVGRISALAYRQEEITEVAKNLNNEAYRAAVVKVIEADTIRAEEYSGKVAGYTNLVAQILSKSVSSIIGGVIAGGFMAPAVVGDKVGDSLAELSSKHRIRSVGMVLGLAGGGIGYYMLEHPQGLEGSLYTFGAAVGTAMATYLLCAVGEGVINRRNN